MCNITSTRGNLGNTEELEVINPIFTDFSLWKKFKSLPGFGSWVTAPGCGVGAVSCLCVMKGRSPGEMALRKEGLI
jgi:hypothetical protein